MKKINELKYYGYFLIFCGATLGLCVLFGLIGIGNEKYLMFISFTVLILSIVCICIYLIKLKKYNKNK